MAGTVRNWWNGRQPARQLRWGRPRPGPAYRPGQLGHPGQPGHPVAEGERGVIRTSPSDDAPPTVPFGLRRQTISLVSPETYQHGCAPVGGPWLNSASRLERCSTSADRRATFGYEEPALRAHRGSRPAPILECVTTSWSRPCMGERRCPSGEQTRRKDSLRGQPHVSCRPADPRRHLRCAGGLDHGNLTLTGEYRDVRGRPAHRARDARLVPHLLDTTASIESRLLGGTALRVLGRRLQSPTRPVS